MTFHRTEQIRGIYLFLHFVIRIFIIRCFPTQIFFIIVEANFLI